jgi:hypothetical protein
VGPVFPTWSGVLAIEAQIRLMHDRGIWVKPER